MALTKKQIIEKLQGIEDLPTIPDAVIQLQSALETDDSDIGKIASLIETDPVLAASVLKIANSAFYTPVSGSIASIKSAVMILGISEVSRLVTAVAMINTFQNFGRGIDHSALWDHSMAVGITTRILARYSPLGQILDTEAAYAAGLFHDLGLLVMDQYFPKEMEAVKQTAEMEERPIWEVEKEVWEMDHGEVGAALIENWGLPSIIASGVAAHHEPGRAILGHRHLSHLVHMAELICVDLDLNDWLETLPKKLEPEEWTCLGLSVMEVPKIQFAVRKEAEKSSAITGIMIESL